MQKRICRDCGKIFNDPCSIFESDNPVPGTCIACAIEATNKWLDDLHKENQAKPSLEQVDQDALLGTSIK